MPTPQVTIRERTSGDRRTPFEAQLKNRDGTYPDLTGCDIAFHLVKADDGTVQINAASASVADEDLAIVQYAPTAEDVDITVGADQTVRYAGWFIVTKDGKRDHYPNNGKTLIFEFSPEY
jgi:hypothetical protein